MTQPKFRLRPAHPFPTEIIDRRKFVGWIGGVLALSACGTSSQGVVGPPSKGFDLAQEPAGPVSKSPVLSVKHFGALGDGITDDTAAINEAVAGLGTVGGTVFVPRGVYLVDPSKSVRLTDNVTLRLHKEATLSAIAVNIGTSNIVLATGAKNVAVIGGKIVGERVGHLGTTGEWGMGIRIMGCHDVRIEGVEIVDCWGDGIYVGANGVGKESQNVTIRDCKARNNRRQGLSITGCIGALIEDSEFTDTNGTLPSSGIDLEPSGPIDVRNIRIRNCLIARNAGHGLLLVGLRVTRARIESNQLTGNRWAGLALVRRTSGNQIIGNTIEGNRENGVLLEAANLNNLVSNTIQANSVSQPEIYSNVLLTRGSSKNRVIGNHFGPLRRLLPSSVPNIVVTPDCMDNLIQSGRSETGSGSPKARSRRPSGGERRIR